MDIKFSIRGLGIIALLLASVWLSWLNWAAILVLWTSLALGILSILFWCNHQRHRTQVGFHFGRNFLSDPMSVFLQGLIVLVAFGAGYKLSAVAFLTGQWMLAWVAYQANQSNVLISARSS